ncbi:uncharacterized protein LOC144123516 [Amblyomma americanum]
MGCFVPLTLGRVCTLLPFLQVASSNADHQLKHDIPSAFKSFENFPSAVAFYDLDKDGDLECLTAERTEFKEDPLSATYIFSFKGLKGHEKRDIIFRVYPGTTPDTNVFTMNDDNDHRLTNHFIYSDYKNCAVMEFPFDNRQECTLWVSPEVKDGVPQSCIDQYHEYCGDGVMAYNKETCAQLDL